jgi:5,6-dimethylbenzimidazole synthase
LTARSPRLGRDLCHDRATDGTFRTAGSGMSAPQTPEGTAFSQQFRAELERLLRWRRDVRRFRSDPVDPGLRDRLLAQTVLAPSVGLSQPARFLRVESADARAKVLANFETANAEALAGYDGDRATLYAGLKLSGLREAPEQLAVFCEVDPQTGAGLGRATMPEMTAYSVVCAVMQLWLAARAEGLGLGWVSILDAARLERDLAVPEDWRLVAYLCLGWPEEEQTDPELDRAGWEVRYPAPVVGIR